MYGCVVDVQAPIAVYDAVHAELMRTAGDSVQGLLVHIGRPTHTGFQVIEVWESREQSDRYNAELVGPLVTRLAGGRVPSPDEQVVQEFDVHGLVLPEGGVFR